jgi:hypothetical protein
MSAAVVRTAAREPVTPVLHRIWCALTDKQEKRAWFSLVVTGLFCAAISIVHYHHELWRDEIHFWALARNSTGLWDLLTGMRRFDGHPFLWYYLLYIASRWSRSEVYLHVVTIAIATGSTYLWLRHANLPRILRVMLLGTYLYFFEYSVMSRNYVLGVFFVFLFCRLYDRRSLHVFRLVLVLLFLTFASAYGTLLAIALGTFLLWQSIAKLLSGRLASWHRYTLYRQWLLSAVVLAVGFFIHVKTTLPPKDAYFGPIVSHTLGPLAQTEFPLRVWSALFPWHWNSDGSWIVSGHIGEQSRLIGRYFVASTAAILSLWLIALRRMPSLVFTVILGLITMAAFQYHQYVGYLRHWGHIWLLLLACIWLYVKHSKNTHSPKLLYLLAGVTMAIQIVTGIRAVQMEIAMPFSSGKEAADYLRTSGFAKEPILASIDHPTSTVAGYLDKGVRFALTEKESQIVEFSKKRRAFFSVPDIFTWARAVSLQLRTPVILLFSYDIGGQTLPDATPELLYVTKQALRADERFWIYQFAPKGTSP